LTRAGQYYNLAQPDHPGRTSVTEIMNLLSILLLAQLSVPARQVLPVLAFTEPGLDDSSAYQGYQTRFFRDAARNTVQIYLDAREGRVVNLLADADDESA